MNQKMQCKDFVELTTAYLEGVLSLGDRAAFETHLVSCANCRLYLDQTRQVIRALGALRQEPVTKEAKAALLHLLRESGFGQKFRLGIGGGFANVGSHIAYFWENDVDFAAGVGLLDAGLTAGDFCVAFGHDAANEKVMDTLGKRGFDTRGLTEAGRLSALGGKSSGDQMLATIGERFQQAQAAGAQRLRLLGNIGWGRPGWPGEDNILEFEAKVTDAAAQFPCVVVCMYDVRALPGRILLKGGFETHPHTIRGNVLRENPYYVPTPAFLAGLRTTTDAAGKST
jgi:hypothetical protein